MKTTIRKRLEKDLLTACARLRHPGRVVAIGAANESALLVERVKRLSDALHRLRADTYGVCIECHEPISPARLLMRPEVETCSGCQTASSVSVAKSAAVESARSRSSRRSDAIPFNR